MSIMTQNLMRMAGTGYGGGTADPSSVYSALLAEGQTGLQTKRYKDLFQLERDKFNQLLEEAKLRNLIALGGAGYGTTEELNKAGQQYGLSYKPTGTSVARVGGTGTGFAETGGAGATEPDVGKVLEQYMATKPYAWRQSGLAGINPVWDPNLANLNKSLAKTLAMMGG